MIKSWFDWKFMARTSLNKWFDEGPYNHCENGFFLDVCNPLFTREIRVLYGGTKLIWISDENYQHVFTFMYIIVYLKKNIINLYHIIATFIKRCLNFYYNGNQCIYN